jgi:hypothetical protein
VSGLFRNGCPFWPDFDNLRIKDNDLIIRYKSKEFRCKITGDPKIVNLILDTKLFKEEKPISELKQLSVYDLEYQKSLKEYIDDLVFALYFKIKLQNIGYKFKNEIKATCRKHKYYSIVNN